MNQVIEERNKYIDLQQAEIAQLTKERDGLQKRLDVLIANDAAWESSFLNLKREHDDLRIELERVKQDRNKQGMLARTEAFKMCDTLTARLATAEAKGAEMRSLIERMGGENWCIEEFDHALSTDCGKGWLSPDVASELRANSKSANDVLMEQDKRGLENLALKDRVKRLEEALDKTRMALKEVTRTPHNPARWMDFVQQILNEALEETAQ